MLFFSAYVFFVLLCFVFLYWGGGRVGELGVIILSCTTIVFHDTLDQLVCLFHMVCFISLSKSQICYLPLSLIGMYVLYDEWRLNYNNKYN